jgi:hypothetical protein
MKKKTIKYLFFNYLMNVTVQFHTVLHYIFILRFDDFAWNCELGKLLNFTLEHMWYLFLLEIKETAQSRVHVIPSPNIVFGMIYTS